MAFNRATAKPPRCDFATCFIYSALNGGKAIALTSTNPDFGRRLDAGAALSESAACARVPQDRVHAVAPAT
jgi:hypothetical protein